MASIPQLATLGSDFSVGISFDTQHFTNTSAMQLSTEHLWISTMDGEQIHGFQFVNLTSQQKDELYQFIDDLKSTTPGRS